ncbi:hypothetical protein H9P43_002052 [Blastocladiella emersonii ATCC 22665]|nr:hypothetical protein H9P43_002052 [Blastocladiella emersonii ATCC 22665]
MTRLISGASLYVALSRLRRSKYMWVLQPIPRAVRKSMKPDPLAVAEDKRLQMLDELTKTAFDQGTAIAPGDQRIAKLFDDAILFSRQHAAEKLSSTITFTENNSTTVTVSNGSQRTSNTNSTTARTQLPSNAAAAAAVATDPVAAKCVLLATAMRSCMASDKFGDAIDSDDKELDQRACSDVCRRLYSEVQQSDPTKCTAANSGMDGAFLAYRVAATPGLCVKRDGKYAWPRFYDAIKGQDPNMTLFESNPAAIDKKALCTPWTETVLVTIDNEREPYLRVAALYPEYAELKNYPNTTAVRSVCGFATPKAGLSGATQMMVGGHALAVIVAAAFALLV